MKKNFKFYKLQKDKDSIQFYKSLSNQILNERLNEEFDSLEFYLNYYAEILKALFNGSDYDEHYYILKSLIESLNDIKIMLIILQNRSIYE